MYAPLVIFIFFLSYCEPARILGVFPTPSISHQLVFQPIWRELSLRGHEVTVVTPDPLKDKDLVNLTEIDVHDISYAAFRKHGIATLGATKETKVEGIKAFIDMYLEATNAQFESPQVQALIHDKRYKFDLLLVEYLWPTAFAFKEVFNCPMIGITSLPLGLTQHDNVGNPTHPITHPDIQLPFTQDLSFFERVRSVIYSFAYRLFVWRLADTNQIQMQKYFPNATKTLSTLAKEVSLTIVNRNPVLSTPRPNVPAVIEVTSLHVRPPKPMDDSLKTFLDSSIQGVVYVSFGSNVQSSQLPNDKLDVLLETFRHLPYNILWKFESDSIENKPSNVYISKWVPQQDVLRHRNVKLFITQGGLQSIEEAIFFGIPLIAIPFFGDQPNNARRVVEVGAGLKLEFLTLTKTQLLASISEVINNKMYKQRITHLSNIVRDQQVNSLDKVTWWIDYVLRYDGAPHLKSPAVNLPLYQYFMIDVFAFLISAAAAALYVFFKLTKLLLNTKFVF